MSQISSPTLRLDGGLVFKIIMKQYYFTPDLDMVEIASRLEFMAVSPFNGGSNWLDDGGDYSGLFGEDK